jgi:hypothetical protein
VAALVNAFNSARAEFDGAEEKECFLLAFAKALVAAPSALVLPHLERLLPRIVRNAGRPFVVCEFSPLSFHGCTYIWFPIPVSITFIV